MDNCEKPGCIWCNMETEDRIEAIAKANQEWTIKASEWISKLPAGTIFTSEDLVEEIGEPHSTGATGGLFQGAHRARIIIPAGYAGAKRKTSHSRVLRIWIKN